RKEPAAVMFVDMVGFTAYCSNMEPEDTIALLRDLQAILSRRVFSRNGTIDKFLGDGLIAIFGLPVRTSHDVSNAVRCAIDILTDIAAWNRQRSSAREEPIHTAIGIHYGPAVQ